MRITRKVCANVNLCYITLSKPGKLVFNMHRKNPDGPAAAWISGGPAKPCSIIWQELLSVGSLSGQQGALASHFPTPWYPCCSNEESVGSSKLGCVFLGLDFKVPQV